MKEKALLHTFRMTTHLAGGIPLLTELVFWALASYNENYWNNWQPPNSTEDTPKGIDRKCSLGSTRNRDNTTLLGQVIAKRLEEAVLMLENIRQPLKKLAENMTVAVQTNPELFNSKEFKEFIGKSALGEEVCPKSAPTMDAMRSLGESITGKETEKACKTNIFGSCKWSWQCPG
jgi:hypothetical protein